MTWGAPNWPAPTFPSLDGGRAPSNPMEMWLSLFPMAPMFGVRWALLDMVPSAGRPGAAAASGARAANGGKTRAEAEARSRREAETLAGAPGSAARALAATVVKRPAAAADESAPGGGRLRLIEGGPEAAATPKPKQLMKSPPAQPDDLKRIKGVGPRVEKMLNELGVHTYAQIAEFDDAVFEWLDPQLGTFCGRGKRDDWVGQAKALVKKRDKT